MFRKINDLYFMAWSSSFTADWSCLSQESTDWTIDSEEFSFYIQEIRSERHHITVDPERMGFLAR